MIKCGCVRKLTVESSVSRQYRHAHVVKGRLVKELTRVFPLAPALARDRLQVRIAALVVGIQNQEKHRCVLLVLPLLLQVF